MPSAWCNSRSPIRHLPRRSPWPWRRRSQTLQWSRASRPRALPWREGQPREPLLQARWPRRPRRPPPRARRADWPWHPRSSARQLRRRPASWRWRRPLRKPPRRVRQARRPWHLENPLRRACRLPFPRTPVCQIRRLRRLRCRRRPPRQGRRQLCPKESPHRLRGLHPGRPPRHARRRHRSGRRAPKQLPQKTPRWLPGWWPQGPHQPGPSAQLQEKAPSSCQPRRKPSRILFP
mmetsp:Transcript_109472/g.309720  ORF Transcript_109472/g.309720 Transcript_109472/m.309720 type:complete len:234 (-) Transcript_109472:124-825(-)